MRRVDCLITTNGGQCYACVLTETLLQRIFSALLFLLSPEQTSEQCDRPTAEYSILKLTFYNNVRNIGILFLKYHPAFALHL